ncbi:unnamed protein product [Microthlaspi erraticum]|uniref:Arabidopsis retrotransposon Orf1 C-terminal domain-containing protein n=1 Tax=Microthlaspi erraticum TaxID=1685480 RepID=A0A6D2K4X3_9BRAS|nr:unnamed protein product [Microthlaspi erraticum]
MRSQFDELDRAELDQGLGDTLLGKGEKKMVTFRQLEICLGSLWRSWSSTDKRRSTPPGWMDIKFCKTNLLIEHKELDGRFQFKFTHPLAGPSKLLLPNPELTTV